MPRLTEALERARASASEGSPRLVSRTGDSGHRSAWRFDEEPVNPTDLHAPVELSDAWQIEKTAPAVSSAAGSEVVTAGPEVHVEKPAQERRVRFADDLEQMEIRSADVGKLVVAGTIDQNAVEQYRSVAAAVHHAQLQAGARVLMVSSAVEGEGKTLTSTNLALTLSHSYKRRVLLVDADLRRPSVHTLLQLDNERGLSDSLKHGFAGGVLPVQRLLPTLWVLTAGHPNPDPMGALVSDTMKAFLDDAVDQFDWIVIDTPPVALLPDANLLASMVDTAILVVSAGTTPYSLVTRAIEALGRARIVGVVLNRARHEIVLGYDHLYSYAAPRKKPRRFGFVFGRGVTS